MALLPNYTNANSKEAYFLRANALLINVSTLNAGNISSATAEISSIVSEYVSSISLDSEYINTSTINTLHVDLDGQILTASATELLLNGVPVATLSSLSSIGDWSLEPAISSVQMAGNDIVDGGTISSLNVRSGNGFFLNLIAFNSLFVSSNTSTISSLIESANVGIFSTLIAGDLSVSSISCQSLALSTGTISSLVGDLAQFSTLSCVTLNSAVATISSLNTNQVVVSTITSDQVSAPLGSFSTLNAGNISTGVIAAGTNMSMTAERFSTVADNGIDILNKAKFSVDAVNGLNGEVNLSARPGYGGIGGTINLLAEGGVTPLGVGYGGEVNITATTGGFTTLALTSAVNLNAAGINSYAGAITPVTSLAGYNFIHGDVGVNLTAGAPSFIPSDPLCVYLYGTNGTLMYGTQYVQGPIRPYSDLTTNPADLYIEDYSNLITRGYVQLRGVSTQTFKGGDTAILGVNRIQFSTAGGALENVSSLNGNPISLYENISSFETASISSLVVSSINNINISSLENISTFNDLQASTIYTSSISTAVIYGANDNLFGLGIQGLEIQTAPAGQVWISSPQTNIAGLTNTSTIASFLFRGRDVAVSSAQVSSLAFAQTAAYGLSSLITLSTSATASGTSTSMVINTDLNLGTNDLFAGQIRLNAGASQNAAEIFMTGPDGRTEAIDLQTGDPIFRNRYGTNAAVSTGYFLDTYGNKPLFSTINNSTCMMAYFPSTTSGTIGVSTLAIIPPIQVYGGFYSSTSQGVAGANTITPLTYNSQSVNVGGLTYAGSTIVVPIAGTYEITHSIQFDTASGGTNEAYFWLKKNGTDIPQSGSIVSIVNNGETLGTISLLDTAAAGDQYAVCIASSDVNMTAKAVPISSFFPAIPSLITNIKRL